MPVDAVAFFTFSVPPETVDSCSCCRTCLAVLGVLRYSRLVESRSKSYLVAANVASPTEIIALEAMAALLSLHGIIAWKE